MRVSLYMCVIVQMQLSQARELDDETGERIVLIAKLNDVFLECESIE